MPSTSLMVESISVVISGSASVMTASTSTGSSTPPATASLMAWTVAAVSTVTPFSEGVMTNSPFSLVMEAFFAPPSIPLHCSVTKAVTAASSTAVSTGISRPSCSRSVSAIYRFRRFPSVRAETTSSTASRLLQESPMALVVVSRV